MLETYLKQITYYKVNVNCLWLRSEVTAVHFDWVTAKVTAITYGTYGRNFVNCIWPYCIIRYGYGRKVMGYSYGQIVMGYGHSLCLSFGKVALGLLC